MDKTIVLNEESKKKARRRIQIKDEINRLTNEISILKKEKEAIEEAMQKVEELSSSSSLSSAENSFTWVVKNMDMYWNATDSSAREIVKDTLTKVNQECGNSGKLLSQVGPIMAKAEERNLEITEKIEERKSKIESLENELNAMIA